MKVDGAEREAAGRVIGVMLSSLEVMRLRPMIAAMARRMMKERMEVREGPGLVGGRRGEEVEDATVEV